ncbi:bifunctional murein DD-endopeptidase/murein LD-carboxypeptidase [soil metagenome]
MFTPDANESGRIILVVTFIVMMVLSSCGVATRDVSQQQRQTTDYNVVLESLNRAHEDWQGTPYILGGSGIGGVDCSSFTQIVFRDYFGKTLPRNTRQQLQVGNGVRRNHINPGDLIFFRTGRNLLHVGIAMENGEFLHASVSSGVMISNLDQRYWASRYLATRRLL